MLVTRGGLDITLLRTIPIFHQLTHGTQKASIVALYATILLACGPSIAHEAQLPVASHFPTQRSLIETTNSRSISPSEFANSSTTTVLPSPPPPVRTSAVGLQHALTTEQTHKAVPRTNLFTTPTAAAARALPIKPPNDAPHASSSIPTLDVDSNNLQTNRTNLLLLGIDQAEAFAGNTDVVMIISIDQWSNSAVVLSIPRDLCLGTCETHTSRIKELYRLQDIEALQQAIHDLTRLRIDYWVLVNFQGVEAIINRLGGVRVWADREFDERFVYLDTNEQIRLVLKEGWNTLNGRETVAFGRSRKYDEGGDFARICRHQRIIHALREQVISPTLIANAPGLITDLNGTFRTNFPIENVRRLGEILLAIPPDRITAWTIHNGKAALLSPVTGLDGSDLLRPNPDAIRNFVKTALVASTDTHLAKDEIATFADNACGERFPEFSQSQPSTTSPSSISSQAVRGDTPSPAG